MYCTKCGRKLAEGEVCNCSGGVEASQNVNNNPTPTAQNTQNANYDPNANYNQTPSYDPNVNYNQTPSYNPNVNYNPNPNYDPNASYAPNAAQTPAGGYNYADANGAPNLIFEPEAPRKKKSKKGLIITLAIIASVVAACAAVWFLAQGWVMKTFTSDETYLGYVVGNYTEDAAESFSEMYGMGLRVVKGTSQTTDTSIKLEIGDTAKTLIQEAVGYDVSLDGLDGLTIDYKTVNEGLKTSLEVALKSKNGVTIATAELYSDSLSGDVMMRIPELSNSWLSLSDMSDMSDIYGDYASADLSDISMDLITQVLPSPETIEELITTVVDTIFDNIKSVNVSDETVTLDGVSQTLTKYSLRLTERDFVDILEATAYELIEDEDFEEAVKDVLEATGTPGMYVDMIWGQLPSLLKAGIAEIRDELDSTSVLAAIDFYIDSNHEIAGLGVDIFDGEIKYLQMAVKNGNRYAEEVKLAVEGELLFEVYSTDATIKNGRINGNLSFWMLEERCFTLEFIGINPDNHTGRMRMKLEEPMIDIISDGDYELEVLLSQLTLEMNVRSADTSKQSIEIALYIGDEMLVAFDCDASVAMGGKVSFKSTSDVLNQYDWEDEVSYDDLIDNLEKAGISEDIIGLFY